MSLRILLADQSSTIKKVIQIALQDFGVQIQNVNTGNEVLEVAKAIKPDVIFVDVILPKRNGYQICQDLKNDPNLKNIPVVLMWSGFIDVDKEKIRNAQAASNLEKPFDSDTLRQTVIRLVKNIQDQPIKEFLSFSQIDKETKSKIKTEKNLEQNEYEENSEKSLNFEDDLFEEVSALTLDDNLNINEEELELKLKDNQLDNLDKNFDNNLDDIDSVENNIENDMEKDMENTMNIESPEGLLDFKAELENQKENFKENIQQQDIQKKINLDTEKSFDVESNNEVEASLVDDFAQIDLSEWKDNSENNDNNSENNDNVSFIDETEYDDDISKFKIDLSSKEIENRFSSSNSDYNEDVKNSSPSSSLKENNINENNINENKDEIENDDFNDKKMLNELSLNVDNSQDLIKNISQQVIANLKDDSYFQDMLYSNMEKIVTDQVKNNILEITEGVVKKELNKILAEIN